MTALFSKITAFFTAIVLFLTSIPVLFYPKVPPAESVSELMNCRLTEKKELGDDIYVVKTGGHTSDEVLALTCLQGIVAKTNPCIYIVSNRAYESYLSELEKSGKNIIRTDENGKDWNLYSLIGRFSSYIEDNGCVIWQSSEYAYSLNVAVNFAALNSWLPVTKEIREKLGDKALTVKVDLTAEEEGPDLQKKYYEQMKGSFKSGAVVHVKYSKNGVRDLAIEQGWYCFYTDGTSEGKRFLKSVLKDFGENTRVLGWVEEEKSVVTLISKQGCSLNPLDYALNTSYLSQADVPVASQENEGTVHTDDSKHYVCLLFSDGDNMQWIINGYSEYFDKVGNYNGIVMNWTFSPMMSELCPFMHNNVYNTAGSTNYFVCGPSGIAYNNPSKYKKTALDGLSKDTAAAMLRSGQRVLTILDDYSALKEADMLYSFKYFSRFDNIDGALLYLDPGRYEAGRGRVWFSDDKPFISTRLSLWHPDGYDGVTDEWLREQAEIINNYPADIHSINGYSLICIHAWSMKNGSIEKFLSYLDDDVVVLSAPDFINTVSANIPHKKAVPDS